MDITDKLTAGSSPVNAFLYTCILVLLGCSFHLSAQQFVEVTSGVVVEDLGVSLGCSWGDFDGDGDEDLFVTNLNHLDNFLYRNDGEGTFTRMTTADVGDLVGEGGLAGVGAWADYDNDGDLDIFVSRIGMNALYRNDGNGFFTSLSVEETGDLLLDTDNSTSGTWGDYDNDGDLDLFVTNIDETPNALYQNKCEGYFVKMTEEEVGPIAGGGGTSFGATWADYDNDGDLDLYVANATEDAGQDNFLYDNNGQGFFSRIGNGSISNDNAKSIGASWGDYNNDGFLDLYVANADGEDNMLFRNRGNGTFQQISSRVPVVDGNNSVGSGWADIDNDGDLDLFVANTDNENNDIYLNDAETGTFFEFFNDVTVTSAGYSSGIGWTDLGGDGWLDLYVTNSIADSSQILGGGEPNFFYLNDSDTSDTTGNWLTISLEGVASNANAIGAKVFVTATFDRFPVTQMREITSLSGAGSQNSFTAHFGLGQVTIVDSISVEWPSGNQTILTNVEVNSQLPIRESSPELIIVDRVIDFGDVIAGEVANRSVNVSNGSFRDLTVALKELVGADADQFTIDTTEIIIPGDGEKSKGGGGLNVSFAPTRNGEFSVLLDFRSDGGTGCVELIGRGIAPVLALENDTLAFQEVQVDCTVTRLFTITNGGQSTLEVTGVSIDGLDAGNFSTSFTGATLPIAQSTDIPVEFTPNDLAGFTAQMNIFSNGGDQSVGLSGIGVTAEISIPDTLLEFGLVRNDSTKILTLTLSNPSSQVLNIFDVSFEGENVEEFALLNGFPSRLRPGEQADIRIQAIPDFPGEKVAQIVIVSNAVSSPDIVPILYTSTVTVIDPVITTNPGEPVGIIVPSPPGFTPNLATLYYRLAGKRDFADSMQVNSTAEFDFQVVTSAADIRGIEYYVRMTDGRGTVTFPQLAPADNPAFIPLEIAEVDYPLPMAARDNRLVSIPLTVNDPQIEEVFSDLGEYNTWFWRLFRWDSESESYQEYPEFGTSLVSGQSYWLVTQDGTGFKVRDAQSVEPDSLVIPLEPGWNQLANPYAFDLNWFEVQTDSGVEIPFTQQDGQFELTTQLASWDGFFVYKDPGTGSGRLVLPPFETFSTDEGKRGDVQVRTKMDPATRIELHASTIGSGLKDHSTVLGIADNAAVGRDQLDYAKPPAFGNYLEIYSMVDGERLAGSFKPGSEDGQFWDITIRSSASSEAVAVDLLTEMPGSIHVLDLDNQHALVVDAQRFVADLGEAHSERHFRVINGNEAFANSVSDGISLVPLDYELAQNFPNPFNPVTHIPYTLKQQQDVRLEIFNVLGQRVKTLVNGVQASGRYTISWDGRNEQGHAVGNGIYVYRLRAGEFTEVRKMVLLR